MDETEILLILNIAFEVFPFDFHTELYGFLLMILWFMIRKILKELYFIK